MIPAHFIRIDILILLGCQYVMTDKVVLDGQTSSLDPHQEGLVTYYVYQKSMELTDIAVNFHAADDVRALALTT